MADNNEQGSQAPNAEEHEKAQERLLDKANQNLDQIWNKVATTLPKFTKRAKVNGHQQTAICATYQGMVATALWGAYGEKWGLRNINYDHSMVESLGLTFLKADFFYPSKEGEGEASFEIGNSHKIWYMTQGNNGNEGYKKIDEDWVKKIETNTISKALAKLGFSADVFMGKFDDADYVKEQTLRQELDLENLSSEEKEEEKKKFYAWCQDQIEAYKLIPTGGALNSAYQTHLKKAKLTCELLNIQFKPDAEGVGGIELRFKKALLLRRITI